MSKKTIEPMELFNLVKHVPSLFETFRKECYRVPPQATLEDNPVPKYDHKLGLAFLEKHGIPTTHEDLFEDGKYTYTSIMTGNIRYNVGQLVVVFSEAIYSSGDMTTNNTWILEVMDEFDFTADQPLTSMCVDDIRIALKEQLDKGIIKLHQAAGIRMYDCAHTYKFAERLNKGTEANDQPT